LNLVVGAAGRESTGRESAGRETTTGDDATIGESTTGDDATIGESTGRESTTGDEATIRESTTGRESTAAADGLALLDALAESLLEADTTGKLSIVSVVVVDEEEFGAGGGRWHLDDFLLGGRWATVEHVYEGLLLGRRHDDSVAAAHRVGGAHEDVVEVDLGVGDGPSAEGLDGLLRGAVQVQVACHLSSDAATVGPSNLSVSAAVTEVDAAGTTSAAKAS